MKKILAVLVPLLALTAHPLPAQTTVANFDNIQFWTGSGTNRAALILEFNSGPQKLSVAWGYRWNGSAVMQDMLFALAGSITGSASAPSPQAGSDPRLAVTVGFFSGFGFFVDEVRYDPAGLGGAWPASPQIIMDDFFFTGTYPSIYWTAGNGTWTGQPLAYSLDHGIATLPLQDGGWFGIIQSDGFDDFYSFLQPWAAPASQPVPVPVVFITIAGGTPTISADSTSGYTYQLKVTGSLTPAVWTNLGAPRAGTGGMLVWQDNTAELPGQRFYRVEIQ